MTRRNSHLQAQEASTSFSALKVSHLLEYPAALQQTRRIGSTMNIRTGSRVWVAVFSALFLACLMGSHIVQACTVIYVGPNASSDGSSFVGHSSDGDGETDPRLVTIPSATYVEGDLRPIYESPESYPRYVGYDRGRPYFPVKGQTPFKPIGYIPQIVGTTYSYHEETYAAVNEVQVSVGEATCSAIYNALPVNLGGKALLSIDELTRIALERSATAKDAVVTMGTLAEKYGFYGPGFEGTGESLVVADPKEAWVFHILPDPTGASAIWAAQRVKSDHMVVVANMFIIREINFNSPDFMYSKGIYDLAVAQKLIKAGDPLDFTLAFSTGEYSHRYYSGRRIWRAMTLAAPSQAPKLIANYTNLRTDNPYPFSIKPDQPMTLNSVKQIYRDYLEGTDMSMVRGMASGPFNTPDRYTGGKGERAVPGSWERPIALFRTADAYIAQLNPNSPLGAILWYGPHAPHGTVFVPFAAGMNALSDAYSYGVQAIYNRTTAFWAHRTVLNLANLKFSYMIEDIRAQQKAIESEAQSTVDYLAEKYAAGQVTFAYVTSSLIKFADKVVERWWKLSEELMFKYADGFINEPGKIGQSPGYPEWWLKDVGYQNGPPKQVALSQGDVVPIPKGLRLI